MFESNNMMEPWIFSNENSDLLNSIIKQSQQESKNGIQNHLQTLFRNNLNSEGNINDTTNFATSIINISNSTDENEEEINQLSKVLDEQSIDIPDDFKFLLDNFENDNGLLLEYDFIQIMNSNQIDNVFMFLEKNFSTEGLYKFCKFLSSMENIENDIIKSFCTKLLYPKFMNSSINTSLQIAIQELFKIYEDILTENLLKRLMEQKNQNLRVLIAICDQLNFNNKYLVLSKLLNSCETLDEEQIELIQTLFVNDVADTNLKLRLINLLYDFVDLFSTSKIYGKLMITLLKSLKIEEWSSDAQNTLQLIVTKNKSIYKRAAQKYIENMKN